MVMSLPENCRGGGKTDHIGSHDLARDHMVEQDVGQRLFVLRQEQAVERACGQGGESVIGGGEDREGTFTTEGFDQFGGCHCGDQGAEALVGGRDVNDGARGGGFFSRGQDDRVDDVDGAVGGLDVGNDDLGIVDEDIAHPQP
jgi:hypothetical protein